MWVWQCLVTKTLLLQWLLWFVPPPALTSSIMTPLQPTPRLPTLTTSPVTTTTANTISLSDNSTTITNTTTTTTNNNNNNNETKCVWKELEGVNFTSNSSSLTVKASMDTANMTVFFHVRNGTSTYESLLFTETIDSKPQNIYLHYKNIGEFAIKLVAEFMGKNYNETVLGEFTFHQFKLTGDILISRKCNDTSESVVLWEFTGTGEKEMKVWPFWVLTVECVILVVAGVVALERYRRKRVRPQY
ncbi:hypothetical protein Pcinc_027115 [Petrolisthes cinctipes]|uniref:Uncharacterized protein n=1 Tax=Petrolisthes cinctipes TaxID=88211 RepID=A0AAE1F4Y3_PETCI|nr:hypothetical protein Pcinc_027115 [Petrolisthes cinctipes]